MVSKLLAEVRLEVTRRSLDADGELRATLQVTQQPLDVHAEGVAHNHAVVLVAHGGTTLWQPSNQVVQELAFMVHEDDAEQRRERIVPCLDVLVDLRESGLEADRERLQLDAECLDEAREAALHMPQLLLIQPPIIGAQEADAEDEALDVVGRAMEGLRARLKEAVAILDVLAQVGHADLRELLRKDVEVAILGVYVEDLEAVAADDLHDLGVREDTRTANSIGHEDAGLLLALLDQTFGTPSEAAPFHARWTLGVVRDHADDAQASADSLDAGADRLERLEEGLPVLQDVRERSGHAHDLLNGMQTDSLFQDRVASLVKSEIWWVASSSFVLRPLRRKRGVTKLVTLSPLSLMLFVCVLFDFWGI